MQGGHEEEGVPTYGPTSQARPGSVTRGAVCPTPSLRFASECSVRANAKDQNRHSKHHG